MVACLVHVTNSARAAVSRVRGALMASRRHNVVVVLLHIAQDLEERHYPMAGLVRQVAREVATMPDSHEADACRCACGQVIVQPRTGRPRKFCLACSPQRKTAGKRHAFSDSPVDRAEGAA